MKLNDVLQEARAKTPGANLQQQSLETLPTDIPTVLNRDFNCRRNKLKSLKGAPQTVNGFVDISSNQITSLEYFPTYIKEYANIGSNNISTFDGLVGCKIGGSLWINENRFTSLKGIEKAFVEINGEIRIEERNKYQIKGYVLGLLKIRNLTKVLQWGAYGKKDGKIKGSDFDKALVIINKFLVNKKGPVCSNAEILECAIELDDAGLEEFSKI